MRNLLLSAAAATALALAAPAYADIVFLEQAGNGNLGTVHLDGTDDGTDTVVNGTTTNNIGVIITGLENISVSANGGGQGQAWVVGTDGTLGALDIALASGFSFQEIDFNLNAPNGHNQPWDVTLTGYDQSGPTTHTFTNITNNQAFDIAAINGEYLTHVSFSTSDILDGVGQIRIGGAAPIGVVPEPASWAMMLLGFGGLGALLRRRRARAAFA